MITLSMQRGRRRLACRTFPLLLALPPILTAPAAAQDSSRLARVAQLPITEVPPSRPGSGIVAVFLSGDGGWADIDRKISSVLAERGIGVVGLNARAYLGRRRTADEIARDVSVLAETYLERWNAQRLVIIGYSRGAGMVPFAVSRFPPSLRQRTVLVALLGLETTANFLFRWSDVFRSTSRSDDIPVDPELRALQGMKMLCVYGEDETDSACRDASPTLIKKYKLAGSHHFDGDYRALGELILGEISP